jgi:hypothetical protein
VGWAGAIKVNVDFSTLDVSTVHMYIFLLHSLLIETRNFHLICRIEL